MKTLKIFQVLLISLMAIFLFTGCSEDNSNKQTMDEKIRQTYVDTNRLGTYNQLVEDYGEKRIILWMNKDEDSSWITNYTLWLVFSILPDMPDILALGALIGIMWAIGMIGIAGGILTGLAWLGGLLGGFPGLPPAIIGMIYLAIMFSVLQKLFGVLFSSMPFM